MDGHLTVSLSLLSKHHLAGLFFWKRVREFFFDASSLVP